jgi:hypothetical protein
MTATCGTNEAAAREPWSKRERNWRRNAERVLELLSRARGATA